MPDAGAISGVGRVTSATRPRLSAEELAQVEKLAARDREVRLHEAQHQAAAGTLAVGGPQFTYQTGPDGKLYAVGGEVKLSFATGQTPEETIRRASQMRAAATAPANPSGQDLAVAAQAAMIEMQARQAQFADRPTGRGVTSASQLLHQAQGLGPE
jgi:hypothetical protein